MTYLYLRYLNFRLWLLRRRLRQMGFRDAVKQITPEMLRAMLKEDERKHVLDLVKIVLTLLAIASMWLIFWQRVVQPIQVILPPSQQASSSHGQTWEEALRRESK